MCLYLVMYMITCEYIYERVEMIVFVNKNIIESI